MDEKKVRKAIEVFQDQVDWLKRIDDKGCEEPCRCCIEYFETAIKALEKQLKMKPVKVCEKECTYYVCPSCKNVLVSEYPNSGTYGEKRDCVMCNQKIDWSERPL